MHLASIPVSLVLRIVASPSTWQRSRSAFKIQGDWQQKDILFMNMETKEDDKRVPSFDGPFTVITGRGHFCISMDWRTVNRP